MAELIQGRFERNQPQPSEPKPVVKLVAIARNEAAYIPAWVFHHFRIGVDLIEIYINNTDDNSLKICRRIKKIYPNFNFIKADHLLDKSLATGKSFQIAAYNKSLRRSKRKKDNATHLLTLDLDEYLTPANLKHNLKNLLTENNKADAISFLWYSDDYSKSKAPFQSHLRGKTTVYRLNHVKTLARVSKRIKSCLHHNFLFKGDGPVSNAFGGLYNIQLSDKTNTSIHRSKVNMSFLDILNAREVEPWFILHCIYRSEDEYLASLCRGRQHNNDSSPLKKNRWGLRPYPSFNPIELVVAFDKNEVRGYKSDYQAFISTCGIRKEIKSARGMIKKRVKELDDLLKSDPQLLKSFAQIFRGTRYEKPILSEKHINNKREADEFDSKRFFKECPDVMNAYNINDPIESNDLAYEMNKFYGTDKDNLSEFSLAEFGYWHTKHHQDKYSKRGEGGNYWMKSKPR